MITTNGKCTICMSCRSYIYSDAFNSSKCALVVNLTVKRREANWSAVDPDQWHSWRDDDECARRQSWHRGGGANSLAKQTILGITDGNRPA